MGDFDLFLFGLVDFSSLLHNTALSAAYMQMMFALISMQRGVVDLIACNSMKNHR